MGVKSTILLTRPEAEARLVQFRLEREESRIREEAAMISDEALECWLERLSDLKGGGEGFENYRVCEGGEE